MGSIKNLPKWHAEVKYIVARKVDSAWWYYWGGDKFEEAQDAAWECGGEIFTEWRAA